MNNTLWLKSNQNYGIIISILGITGLITRLFFIPYQIPISLDGLDYFAFSVVLNNEKSFPEEYISGNFGWPIFLSWIFSFLEYSEMLKLMDAQRVVTSIISTISIIPVFLLLKIFFRKEVALVGATLFLFDPRIIENSLLGITEPLFIFLITLTIFFVFFKKAKFLFFSFICAGFATIVRYEGVLLLIPIILTFLINREFNKKSLIKIASGIFTFVIILVIMSFIAYQGDNTFGIISPVIGGGNYFSNTIINDNSDPDDEIFGENAENRFNIFLYNSIQGYVKYLGWTLIPVQLVFVIGSIIVISKKITKQRILLFMFFGFLSISSIYAFRRGIQDPRYLFPLIPIFSLFGCVFIEFLRKKKFENKILLFIPIIIITSLFFVVFNQSNLEFEEEFYLASKFLIENADGVNEYDRIRYLRPSIVESNWPDMSLNVGKKIGVDEIKIISSKKFTDLKEYIDFGKNNGLTHLIVTNNDEGIFKDVFEKTNESRFFTEVYKNESDVIKIKIVQINYNKISQ